MSAWPRSAKGGIGDLMSRPAIIPPGSWPPRMCAAVVAGVWATAGALPSPRDEGNGEEKLA
jgi:hypothetical protein